MTAHDLDLVRRVERADAARQEDPLARARADGRREALAEVLDVIDRETAGNYIYQRAGKRIAVAIGRLIKGVNASLTQA